MTTSSIRKLTVTALVAAAALGAAPAHASRVLWSIGIGVPGISIGLGNGYGWGGYYAPVPVYYAPMPLFYGGYGGWHPRRPPQRHWAPPPGRHMNHMRPPPHVRTPMGRPGGGRRPPMGGRPGSGPGGRR